MTIDEYAAWAASVAKVDEHPSNERLSYLGLGLAGESGEVADHIKKLLRDDWLDKAGLVDELRCHLLLGLPVRGHRPAAIRAAGSQRKEDQAAAERSGEPVRRVRAGCSGVMAGHSRPKDGVASARLCPGHPRSSPSRQNVDARDKPGHDDVLDENGL